MVWIHGGAFTAGESDDFDASRLASLGGVIVVTINYRLGVFGISGASGVDGRIAATMHREITAFWISNSRSDGCSETFAHSEAIRATLLSSANLPAA